MSPTRAPPASSIVWRSGDRRVVLVHLTDAGAQVFGDLVALRRTMLSKVLGELSEEEMTALLVGMRAIQAARSRLLAEAAATVGYAVLKPSLRRPAA